MVNVITLSNVLHIVGVNTLPHGQIVNNCLSSLYIVPGTELGSGDQAIQQGEGTDSKLVNT